jgi:putative nucleotidyltransferase with HDIG domain
MPGLSGVEFLERAGRIVPDAIKMILTGYADVQAAVDAINRGGAARYIAKPWRDEELVAILRDAAKRYSLTVENRRLSGVIRRQNDELKKWNGQLEVMVQEQTIHIQDKNKELEKLNGQLRKNFRKSIEAFSSLIEMRERSVSSHSKNVAALARQIAASMSLSDEEVSTILVAGLLHDIGKIGVPDAVLLKGEDEMTDSEKKECRLHPVRGQVAVESIEGFQQIGMIIRHHHEHVDGTGYPDGLKRGDIPLGSRIIAIADAVDKIANAGEPSAESYRMAIREIEFYLDTRYERYVFQHVPFILQKNIEALEKQSIAPGREMEILPDRLLPGMVITRDVKSGTGLLIIARGVVLDQKSVLALQRYFRLDPPKHGIFVRKVDLGQRQ